MDTLEFALRVAGWFIIECFPYSWLAVAGGITEAWIHTRLDSWFTSKES